LCEKLERFLFEFLSNFFCCHFVVIHFFNISLAPSFVHFIYLFNCVRFDVFIIALFCSFFVCVVRCNLHHLHFGFVTFKWCALFFHSYFSWVKSFVLIFYWELCWFGKLTCCFFLVYGQLHACSFNFIYVDSSISIQDQHLLLFFQHHNFIDLQGLLCLIFLPLML